MRKLKDILKEVQSKILKENNSLFKKNIGPYFLSIIVRGSSSMESPSDYEESMIFKKDPITGDYEIAFQDSGSWANIWDSFSTEEDVENFIKEQE